MTTHLHRRPLIALGAAVTSLVLAAGIGALDSVATASQGLGGPIVSLDGGDVRGAAVGDNYAFRGLPYAAPPVGALRWRPPRQPADWEDVLDATGFAPSCPQPAPTAGPQSEDCLFLNVITPRLGSPRGRGLPVLVWVHGGGFVTGAGREYDGSRLAADGVVVVTVNYRLGALGFLAHPALASPPGGPSGNYGLMDQQAALRWVRENIRAFGGDPGNVSIAGESAGGLAVLAHLVSPGSRGLFQRAIVQSGSFGLNRRSLAEGQAFGEAFASRAGCPGQTAACLRSRSVDSLLNSGWPIQAPESAVVDGRVITESFDSALRHGRFARVPFLNGTNHDEEAIFVLGLGRAVSGGAFVAIPELPVNAENYQRNIAAVLGVSDQRAAAIAAEYPVVAFPAPTIAFSALVNDSNFACPALQMDTWAAEWVPTFGYEFNDDAAPGRFVPTIGIATHLSELGYLFDLPDAPFQDPLTADQQSLATAMRGAWADFARGGDPSSSALPWPRFEDSADMLSLVAPTPQVEPNFAARHHCAFWSDAT
ncbi:MAG TPA: carboxylesterase family protein [Actinomycetes bacterium]|nr:carboxylesterase family protein [Actinomycetes bacterium]